MFIEEIKIELNLRVYKKSRIDFLKSIGRICDNGYFIVTDDGTCHLFDEDGNEDDISKVTKLYPSLVPKDIIQIVIPNGVTYIEYGMFLNCSGLRNVTIPNSVISIGDYAFANCSSLTNVTIPDNVTSISGGAFYGCSGLMSITIPISVTSIGYQVFEKCNNFKNLIFKNKTIDQVKAMENYPFGLEDESIIKCEMT